MDQINLAQYVDFGLTREFQDTFSWGQSSNGSALVQAAANGKDGGGPVNVTFSSLGTENAIKNRVYIKIPQEYLGPKSKLKLLSDQDKVRGYGGIYFPTTPTIKQNYKANWQATNAQQTNYAVYSYLNSDVGTIQVSGEFPIQTFYEGTAWITTVHALRSLVKMRTGNDSFAGSPPPVCRFFAHGPDVYHGVPVVIGGFSIDLPSDVDYIRTVGPGLNEVQVPVLSTISVELIPVYSRREMSNFSVTGFIDGTTKYGGYV